MEVHITQGHNFYDKLLLLNPSRFTKY